MSPLIPLERTSMSTKARVLRRVPGYVATAIMITFATVWAFWGAGEMYHEGWWGAWTNRLPYLLPIALTLVPTLVALTFTPDAFTCGVDMVGPSNLITLLNTIPPYWQPLIDIFTKRVGDHRTEEGRKLLTARSPLSRVQHIRKPLLIAQGANDVRCKQAESDQIVAAMKEKNIPVTYVLYPDEGHGFARPENRTAFYAVTEVFLAEHLGGRYQPLSAELAASTMLVPAGADDIPGLPETIKRRSIEGSDPT